MEFEPVNVHGNPARQAELEALGVPRVPATVLTTALGDELVHGWNPAALAKLVGVEYEGGPALTPAELAQAQDNILYYAQHLVKRLSAHQLALKHPERDRTLRNLTFHIFRLSVAFVDAMEQRQFPLEWLIENVPDEMETGEAVAEYGAGVRARLGSWFEAASAGVYAETVPTYYGGQSAHDLLERTTWHAGQHLRQVYNLLERDGSLPGDPLPMELFEGLPLPEELW